MGQAEAPSLKLDLKGLLCPIPILKIQDAMKGVEKGSVIEVICDDIGAYADIPALCKSRGYELISIEKEGRIIMATIKK